MTKKLIDLAARAMRRNLKSANQQIGSTKSVLGSNNASGSLVIMNETQPMIDVGALCYSLKKLWEADFAALEHLHFVLICVEAHKIRVANDLTGYPLAAVYKSSAEQRFLDMMARMTEAWAWYNGGRSIVIESGGDWAAMDPVYEGGAPTLDVY